MAGAARLPLFRDSIFKPIFEGLPDPAR